MKQETLFDVNDIAIDSNYVSPTIKRKWSSKLRKYLEERYAERGERMPRLHICNKRLLQKKWN